MKLVDTKGNIIIDNGNGTYRGNVIGSAKMSGTSLTAKGEILHGRREGKWVFSSNGQDIIKEFYEDGKFLKGTYTARFNDTYSDQSFFNTFFKQSYINELELYKFEKCSDSQLRAENKKYSFDMTDFRKHLSDRISQTMRSNALLNTQSYVVGSTNYFSLRFAVNEEGKAVDFATVSGWGEEFYSAVTPLIKSRTKFSPTKELYFHLKLTHTGGSSYWFSFRFSKNSTPDL